MPTKLPHYRVYTRIGRSKIHGIGVIAIQSIKKGSYIFFPDNDKLIWVNVAKIRHLPKEIQNLYEDFCIKKDGRYGCPINFNKLTPAWFLNHSAKPNVAADDQYRFFALKNIKKGNELTANYSEYSEMAEVWRAQKNVKSAERVQNPVLQERQRRRR
jgi:SET domain-containing protein